MTEEFETSSGKRVYIEKNKKDLIKKRYSNGEIKLDSSYIYEKMQSLIDNKIYLETWNIPRAYVYSQWFLNVFELHQQLEKLIMEVHLPNRNKKIYNKFEKYYMDKFEVDRGIVNYYKNII